MNKYFLNTGLILFLMFSHTTCTRTQSIPDWASGTWEGPLSHEHIGIDYPIKIVLNKSGKNRIEYLNLKCIFKLKVISVSEETIELNEEESNHKCNSFGGGTIKLSKIDYFGPNHLHMEYYPRENFGLWLAQIEKKAP